MRAASRFLCLDCGIDTGKAGEFYVLRDDVWLSVNDSAIGMLCVGCLEARLGRELQADDFTASYVNAVWFGVKSMRLLTRLTRG